MDGGIGDGNLDVTARPLDDNNVSVLLYILNIEYIETGGCYGLF